MKTQIRKSCFETNSSSMHAIVISKEQVQKDSINIYHPVRFEVHEFGWEHVRYYDSDFKAMYIWTCVVNNFLKNVYTGKKKKAWNGTEYDESYLELDINNPEYKNIKKTITKYLKNNGFNNDHIIFQETFEKEDWGSLKTGYIDHDPGIGFVKEILSSEDRFIRFLFNRDSMIETWNDNEWEINEDVEEALENKYWDEEKQQYKDGYWDAEEWAHFKLPISEDMIEWKYLKSN